MVVDLTLQMALYHLGISLAGWTLAILAGGGLGYLLAFFLRYFIQRVPWFLKLLVIFPWRFIATLIALVLSRSAWMQWQFGLGFPADAFTIAGVLVVFIIPWVVQTNLAPFAQRSRFEKMVSYARTLAVISLSLAVFLHSGIGNFMDWAYSQNDFQRVNQGYLVVGLMMLVLDLLFGLVQAAVFRGKAAKIEEAV